MSGGDRPVLSPAGPAEVRETHSAVVLLMGDRAYKVKKPVDLGFLDFTTPERRRLACRRELAVNRRIAPDVYLGVAAVRMVSEGAEGAEGAEGTEGAGAAGDPSLEEHVLVMRRMPDDRRLARLVRDGVDVRDDLRRLARLVAAFHATARTNDEIARSGSPAALTARWQGNLDRFRAVVSAADVRASLDVVEGLAADYVDGRHPLLEARMRAGLVRDGHGDLLADDIFLLPDGPRVLDALDFDERLRWLDVLDDVACLAMDLEHLGAPQRGEAFLRDYAEFSGSPHPASLVHHYVAYRAVMRAMVTAVRHSQQPDPSAAAVRSVTDIDQPADPVRHLLGIGRRHLEAGRVRLVVVAGGPASGKTTLADALADRHDLAVLSSDRVRKELVGLDPRDHHPAAYGQGIYRPEVTERVYERLLHQSEVLLGLGRSVVVDATFSSAAHRLGAELVAARTHSSLTVVRCLPPGPVVVERLRQRESRPDRLTDADRSIADALARETDGWPPAVGGSAVQEVDTSRPTGECVDAVTSSWT